jgi:hypothetical protein
VARPQKPADKVFLNIPYDEKFKRLFLAFIAGVSAFGMVPRATLEIPTSKRRLERILGLIGSCQFSIHDLGRVELDRIAPRTPRFNMPFELGLSVAHEKTKQQKHEWFVCESKRYRIGKSLSDLDGTDPFIHDGRIEGVFRELGNIFLRPGRQPSVQQMRRIYVELRRNLPIVLHHAGSATPYTARVFRELCVIASTAADNIVI